MLKKLKYFFYRWQYINAPSLSLKKPVDLSLELSSYCTNSCGYCYHADPKNLQFQRGKMSKDMAFKIIHEASDIGVKSLKFNYRGEATMNKHFGLIATEAKALANGSTFIDRVVNSNFNFDINRDDIYAGLRSMTKVKVSFDSFIKPIFESQRKGSHYESTIANIDKFYHDISRDNILVIQSVRTQKNKDEDLHYEIKKRWPEAIASIRDVVEGRVNKDLTDILVKKRDLTKRQSCIQAHARMIIHWDGRVAPCCPSLDNSLIIGDYNKQSLLEIWNSIEARSLRQDLLSKKAFNKNPCLNCPSHESFVGYVAPKDS